jgi:hypothetical protein
MSWRPRRMEALGSRRSGSRSGRDSEWRRDEGWSAAQPGRDMGGRTLGLEGARAARAEVRHVQGLGRCLGRGASRPRNRSRGEGRGLEDERSGFFFIEMVAGPMQVRTESPNGRL